MLFSYLIGTCRIDIASGYADRFFDAAFRRGVSFRTVTPEAGFIKSAVIYAKDERKAEKLLSDAACEYRITRKGLPQAVLRLIRSPGVIVGVVLSAVLAAVCSGYVWEVRVSGSPDIPKSEIVAAAEKAGVFRGMKKSGADEREAANAIISECPDVAFASVNIRGAVAFIDVRERETHEVTDSAGASDLVAAFSGVVTGMNVRSGDILVRIGDTVSAGDVLVTGTRIYESGLTYLMRSVGEVYASVNTDFTVSVPLVGEETVLTGRETVKKSVNFLTNRLNIAINSSKIPANCDIIYEERNLSLFGMRLPVYISTVRYRETERIRTEKTAEEAEAEAFAEYAEILESLAAGGELIASDMRSGVSNGEYVITFRAEYITDIAAEKQN
ncbi:MAG: sporulation protein YqfD [Clostridia bacterium]|nr:sporulation protein YqfD [Clostridia bacterium]